MPLWEAIDEYSHFAYVARVALGTPLITEANTVPPDVTSSFELVPVPKAMIESLTKGSHQSYETYWKLSAETRTAWQAQLRNLPPATSLNLESHWLPIYERQQPPLYYWLLVPLYRAFRQATLPDRVLVLRLAGVLLGSSIVPITYFLGTALGGRLTGVAAAALLVSMPQLLITASRVGNEALAMAVGACIMWTAVRLTRQPGWKNAVRLGVAFSAALLTKAYFLSTLTVVLVWFVTSFRASRRNLAMTTPLWLLPLVTSGWWYVRNLRLTGSLSGEQMDAASAAFPWSTKIQTALSMNWLRALDSLMIGHTFSCGWTGITVRAWMYHLVLALWLMAALGVVGYLIRRKNNSGYSIVSLALAIAGGMMAALAYFALVGFLVVHHAATGGSYLFSVAAAEGILLAAGLMFWSRRYGLAVVALGALLFAAIDLFGLNIYALPYYTGLIAPAASGALPAWKLSNAPHEGALLFQHLALNKPLPAGPGQLSVLWVLYVAATLTVPAVLGVEFRRQQIREQSLN